MWAWVIGYGVLAAAAALLLGWLGRGLWQRVRGLLAELEGLSSDLEANLARIQSTDP